MRLAVTGGGGFLGRAALAHASAAGHDAWSVDRADGVDVRDEDALARALTGANVVVHLAGTLGTAELFDTPHEAVDVNVNGTLNVLRWCREAGAAYVGISMPAVFPSVYTATKICAARLATAWYTAYGVPVSHVRAYNAYGPGQAYGPRHPQKILPTFARYAWENRPVPVWGDGMQTVDLVHADDVGRMLVDAASHDGRNDVYDAGTGVAVTVRDVAEFVLRETGSSGGINYLPMRVGEVPTGIAARGEGWGRLGWHPLFDWGRVAETVQWYRS